METTLTRNSDEPGEERIRTLLVDDSAIITDLLKTFLMESGHFSVVGISTDGWEAISESDALNPDLIIMDISMPNFNGLRSAEVIKSKEKAPKIILLTLESGTEFQKEAERIGVDGFCDKLHLEQDLLKTISGLFPGRF